MRKNSQKKKKIISVPARILFLFAMTSAIIHLIAKNNVNFAEWITQNVGFYVRSFLASLTSWIPFSLAEVLIVLSPIILVLIIIAAAKRRGFRSKIRFLAGLLAFLSLFYSGYVFTLGVGYHRTSLASRMEIGSVDITKENLYETMNILSAECEKLLDEIEFSDSGSSLSPISFDEICEEVLIGYERLEEDIPSLEIKTFDSTAKDVHFSKAMTWLDLLGVYTYFTGESNVNVHYPDYTAPHTVAHELAHQRGISREDEANFIAFLVCIRSDNVFVKYSGYMNMFEYVASALSKTDKTLYRQSISDIDKRMYNEMVAYNNFYRENKNELLGKISETVNDNYLKAQGTAGVISYGLVVRLAVSYYTENP